MSPRWLALGVWDVMFLLEILKGTDRKLDPTF